MDGRDSAAAAAMNSIAPSYKPGIAIAIAARPTHGPTPTRAYTRTTSSGASDSRWPCDILVSPFVIKGPLPLDYTFSEQTPDLEGEGAEATCTWEENCPCAWEGGGAELL